VLSTKIGGKTFNPDKNYDPASQYGKGDFAEKVIRPNAHAIDFTGFGSLLARFDAVIDDYTKRKVAHGGSAVT
jgi:RNA-directed DNA polymerase